MASIFEDVIDTLYKSGIKLSIAIAVIGGVAGAAILSDNSTLVEILDTLGDVPTWLGLFLIVAFGTAFVVLSNMNTSGGSRRRRR